MQSVLTLLGLTMSELAWAEVVENVWKHVIAKRLRPHTAVVPTITSSDEENLTSLSGAIDVSAPRFVLRVSL